MKLSELERLCDIRDLSTEAEVRKLISGIVVEALKTGEFSILYGDIECGKIRARLK